MEKILPHFVGPRFFDSSKDEKQYRDRLVVRGIQVVRDEDSDDRPKWRGDHSFSVEAANYSLTNFIEPEVKKKHPDWTHEKVHENALWQFEKRLHQDQSFEKKETAHEESRVFWQPIQTDKGWELATVYGDTMITLSDLWEHTKEFAAFAGNPAAYNAEEHIVQLRMQDAFIRGEASGFVSILSHPDSIRYVQVWKKNDDGTIVSTHIDLHKTTGRDFTHEEGILLIRNLQSLHGGDTTPESSYAYFMSRKEEVSEQHIRSFAILQTAEVTRSVGKIVFSDTTDSMMMLGTSLRNQIERRISDYGEHTRKKRKMSGEHTVLVNEKKHTTQHPHTKRYGQEPIKLLLADWWVTKGILHQVDRVPVAAVAALTWATRDITSSPIESIIVRRTSEKTTNDRKEARLTQSPVHKKFSERAKEWIVKSTKKLIWRAELVKTPVSTVSRIKKVESDLTYTIAVRNVFLRFVERVRHVYRIDATREIFVRGRVLNAFREKSRRFIELTKRTLREIVRRRKPTKDTQFQTEVKVREHFLPIEVPLLRFAFLVWWAVYFHRGTETSSERIESVSRRKNVSVETDQTPWILLSIIWYLTMLRESGKAGSRFAGKKKGRRLLWHHISLRFVIE